MGVGFLFNWSWLRAVAFVLFCLLEIESIGRLSKLFASQVGSLN